jgi:dTDP-4-amino-4,6-dideoxygalactose transaminase
MGMIKLPNESIDFFKANQDQIFESGALAEGSWNNQVQDWICQYTNSTSSLSTSSNGTGLLAVLQALKYANGYEYIFLQSNTMYGMKTLAVSSGLELNGFVNCELKTLMPSLALLQEFIETIDYPEKSVFLLTHIGGWSNPEIIEIANFCKDKGIALVEDCAHSLGTIIDGKHTGTFGEAGVYSLYSTKAIPVGEGGIVITNNEEIGDQIQRYSIYDRFDQKQRFGVNNRMSEINALLTFSVLMFLEEIIENKYDIANQYIEICNNKGINYFNPKVSGQRANLYKFILFNNQNFDFSTIKTRTSPVYDYSLGDDPEEIVSRHICLPIWYKLEDEVVSKVKNELQNL